MESKNNRRLELLETSGIDDSFLMLYRYFPEDTRKTIHHVFYSTMKVLFCRYRRKKEIWENQSKMKNKKTIFNFSLKRKDLTSILLLVDHYLSNIYTITRDKDPLVNFGNFPYDKALDYYDESVEGIVKDIYGREIILDEEGVSFCFDHDISLAKDKYVDSRGKRLSWIRPTLENTKAIYEITEDDWTSYYYLSKFNVPFTDPATGVENKSRNYFFIVVRRKSERPLQFITAYHMEEEVTLLKRLEPSHPYVFDGGKMQENEGILGA